MARCSRGAWRTTGGALATALAATWLGGTITPPPAAAAAPPRAAVAASSAATPPAASTSTEAAWQVTTSFPPPLVPHGVACPSASRCVAVGSNGSVPGVGLVATTGDGGAQWAEQPLPTGIALLSAVACPTATNCFAAGQATTGLGAVLGTTDGGSTWTLQTLPAGTGVLSGIACPTASQCIAVGSGRIVETTDAGATWSGRAMPTGATELGAVACPSTVECVASGVSSTVNGSAPVVVESTDGGSTWTLQTLPAGTGVLSGIACPSASVCFATGTDTSGASVVVASKDAGATWTSTPLPSGQSRMPGISCASASTCVVVGQPSLGAIKAAIVATTDGGSTWTSQSVPPGTGGLLGVACPTASVCVAVGPQQAGLPGVILATTNGGATWEGETVPPSAGSFSTLSCPSASVCFATGTDTSGAGAVFTSADAGKTWTSAPLPSGANLLAPIACASTSACVVVGGAAGSGFAPFIVATTDGGATWTRETVPAGVESLHGVACPTSTTCFAVGDASQTSPAITGTLIATTNGGATWTKQAVPAGLPPLGAITCASASACFAAGGSADEAGAAALATTNGGATWTRQALPSAAGATTGIACSSTLQCIAVGFTATGRSGASVGSVASTTDGGAAWALVGPSALTGAVTGVACLPGGACDAVAGAAILATPDLGHTWTSQRLPSGVGRLDAIACRPSGTCFAAGYGTQGGALVLSGPGTVSSPLPSAYVPLTPSRICDTRAGQPANQCTGNRLGPGATDVVTVAGQGGVPATGASAVVVDVTAVDATQGGYFTVWPDGDMRPLVSSVNLREGASTANLVTMALPADGRIDVFNAVGAADLVVDVEGYFAPMTALGAGIYTALRPSRICDTRTGQPANQCTSKAPGTGGTLDVAVDGEGGVPSSGVAALVLNVTAIGSPAPGYLTVYPSGTTRPTVSNVNYRAGEIVANRVVVPVGTSGAIAIYVGNGSPQVAVDVAGWFTDNSNPDATGALFTPVASPARICDTRAGQPANQCTAKPLSPGATLAIQATGANGVPAGAVAVVVNVTAAGETSPGYLTVLPSGTSRPVASDLNFTPGAPVANMVVATLGPGGAFSVYNSAGTTDVVVDLVGWYF